MGGVRVVYVTRTGHARALAELIAGRWGGKPAEIGDPESREGFLGFMRSGSQAMKRAEASFIDPKTDLAGADAVVMVMPVWASAVCPTLRSWILAHREELRGKKLGLLCTNKGSPGAPVKAKFEEEFGPLAAFAVLREKDGDDTKARVLDEFAAALG